MSQFNRAHTTSYSTNTNFVFILCHFPVIASYLSKVAYFYLPHLHLVPLLGVLLFEFCRDLWRQQSSSCTIVRRCLRDPKFSRFDTIVACVCLCVCMACDRHTHRPTDRRYANTVLAVVVCLSVHLSVTRLYCVKTAKHWITQATAHDSPGTFMMPAPDTVTRRTGQVQSPDSHRPQLPSSHRTESTDL